MPGEYSGCEACVSSMWVDLIFCGKLRAASQTANYSQELSSLSCGKGLQMEYLRPARPYVVAGKSESN